MYRKNKENTVLKEELIVFGDEDMASKPKIIRSKYNTSLEKRIEHLWREAEHYGWSFSNFVSVVLEVLTVLHHRNKCLVQARADIGAKIAARREGGR